MLGGDTRNLYRDIQLVYIEIHHENPANNSIYIVHEDIGLCILHLNDEISSSMRSL